MKLEFQGRGRLYFRKRDQLKDRAGGRLWTKVKARLSGPLRRQLLLTVRTVWEDEMNFQLRSQLGVLQSPKKHHE